MTPLSVTNNTFAAEVLDCRQPVLVDFWASWCAPCKMIAPIVDELCAARADIKVCKVNVDEQFELAVRYQVSSIPTLMVFLGGKAVRRVVGLRTKAEIEQILEECLHEHSAE
ncbi:MAG: thioredoxin [Clostridia bacterium]|nr:thioredoxin [Clostridia bacterium]